MNRNAHQLSCLVSALAGGMAVQAAASKPLAPAKPPNIVFIFTDQQFAGAMSNAGCRYLSTPAMDSLARDGVRFDAAYCTFPLCTPSRASMMTGRMPSELGIRGNERPIPEPFRQQGMGWVFRNAGYETAYAGKWHLPRQIGEEHGFEVLAAEFDDEIATPKSVEFIRRRHDKPFLLVTSYVQPHDVCSLHRHPDPRKRRDKIAWPANVFEDDFVNGCPPLAFNAAPASPRPEAVALLRNKQSSGQTQRPSFWAPEEQHNAARFWEEEQFRHYLYGYYRLVEWVDGQIGQILDALRENGLDENTLVIFSSDHGEMMGAHGLTAKVYLYEESIRIPLILRLPGRIPAGHVVKDHLVSNGLDLLPTLCDYAGIAVPEGLQGRSLRTLAEGRIPATWRSDLVIETSLANGRLVHTGKMKYMVYGSGQDAEELFDLEKDPGELHNRIYDPDYQDEVVRQRERLARWFKESAGHP